MNWKLTPAKPTPEMQNMGCDARLNGEAAAGIYRAMLSAAPDPLEDAELRERVARAIDAALPDHARPYNRETVTRAAIAEMRGE